MNWKNLRVWDQTFSEIFRHFQTFSDQQSLSVSQWFRKCLVWYQTSSYTDCQYISVIFRPAVSHPSRLPEHLSYIQFSSSAVTQTMGIYQLISALQLSSKPAFQTTSYSQTISDILSVLVNQMSDSQTFSVKQFIRISDIFSVSVISSLAFLQTDRLSDHQ